MPVIGFSLRADGMAGGPESSCSTGRVHQLSGPTPIALKALGQWRRFPAGGVTTRNATGVTDVRDRACQTRRNRSTSFLLGSRPRELQRRSSPVSRTRQTLVRGRTSTSSPHTGTRYPFCNRSSPPEKTECSCRAVLRAESALFAKDRDDRRSCRSDRWPSTSVPAPPA